MSCSIDFLSLPTYIFKLFFFTCSNRSIISNNISCNITCIELQGKWLKPIALSVPRTLETYVKCIILPQIRRGTPCSSSIPLTLTTVCTRETWTVNLPTFIDTLKSTFVITARTIRCPLRITIPTGNHFDATTPRPSERHRIEILLNIPCDFRRTPYRTGCGITGCTTSSARRTRTRTTRTEGFSSRTSVGWCNANTPRCTGEAGRSTCPTSTTTRLCGSTRSTLKTYFRLFAVGR